MNNIVQKIIKNRIDILRVQKKDLDEISLSYNVYDRKKLSENIPNDKKISIISEIKPASPLLGQITKSLNVSEVAKKMEEGGAVGLSVLTEPSYFNGSFENLMEAMKSSTLPCLMKDFIIDEIQMEIAKSLGVKNILLINSIIDIEEMFELSVNYNLEALIEIHTKEELDDIEHLFEIGFKPRLIGVNNRDLETLDVKLTTSKQLIPKIRKKFGSNLKIISESGIETYKDIQYLLKRGVDGFLIGSSIMKAKNIVEKIKQLRGI